VVLALVVKLPCCPSPVALPVLFRLWRGKGTASQVQLAAQLLEILVRAFRERQVHGTGDAAFHGESLVIKGTTWTTRLPASAVISGPKPPPTGRRGRPREQGDRIGTCADAVQAADWQDVTVRIYGKRQHIQAAAVPGLWYGSFKGTPGQLVLMREPGSKKPYDLGIFTLDTSLSPGAAIERYSWRWPIEMVFPQLAKRAVRSAGGGREHVADLDFAVGDDHAVDEQLSELPPLLEGGGGQPGPDGLAEALDPAGDSAEFQPLLRDGVQLALLGEQRGTAAVQVLALTLQLRQSDDLGQVGVQQPLLLAV
jgi:hypothetical protein